MSPPPRPRFAAALDAAGPSRTLRFISKGANAFETTSESICSATRAGLGDRSRSKSGGRDAIAVWRRLGVKEIWVCGTRSIRFHVRGEDGRYKVLEVSDVLSPLTSAQAFDWTKTPPISILAWEEEVAEWVAKRYFHAATRKISHETKPAARGI